MKTGVLVIMAFKYKEEQLNKLDKELLISLFLGMQDQMEVLTKQTEALNAADDGTIDSFKEKPIWQVK